MQWLFHFQLFLYINRHSCSYTCLSVDYVSAINLFNSVGL